MPNRFDIDIELFAFPGLPAPDLAGLRHEVEEGLTDLWPALGLPAEPLVSVRTSTEPGGLFHFLLRLDGQIAPTPVFRPGSPAAPLAFSILSAIFEQRTRLITDEQLRQLREQCFSQSKTPPSWSSAPLPVWRALAVLLLENGFSLDRLTACFEHWSPGKSPEEAFERLIENLDMLNLTLVVRPELAQAHLEEDPGWETRFPEFYRLAYQDFGIVLPQIRLEQEQDLPEGRFRLRLNDLWVPVLAGPGVGEALYDNPALAAVFLPVHGIFLEKKQVKNAIGQEPVVAGPWMYTLDWLTYWVTRNAAWYVNAGILESLMDDLETSNRSLIVMTREQWPTSRLCAVLRLLLREQVSIRNLSEILDALLRLDGTVAVDETQYMPFFTPVSRLTPVAPGMNQPDLTDAQLAGQVRASMRYPIVFPYLKNGMLPTYGFSERILRDFREGFFRQAEPRAGTTFHALLQAISEQTSEDWPKPVFLAPTGIRPAVVAALRPYIPGLTVLSYDEVPSIFVTTAKAIIE